MRSLAASQTELATRSALAPIVLVHLTTYTDYTLGTVDSHFYWTRDMPVLYEWGGGAAQTFEDAIVRLPAISRSMQHQPNGGLVDLRQTSLELVLSNDLDAAGVSRWQTFRAENLPFARVEIATLLVNPARLQGPAPWDLRDLPGTEHVFHFRGELTGIGQVTETEIPLTFETREPVLPWPFCSVPAECDPKDLGKRYPIPVGAAKGVPVINRKVGWVTTLAAELTPSTTGNVTITDATGLAGAGIELQIGAERVLASYVNPTTINLTARGQQGTTALVHKVGEVVIEILSSSTFIFSGIQAKALDALYVVWPLTGQKVLIPSSGFTTTLADSATDSGRTISTVTFTAAQFRTMIDRMLQAVSVSQQPDITGGAASTIQVPFQAFSAVSRGGTDTDAVRFSAPDAFRHNYSGAVDEAGRVWWESDAGIPDPTAAVVRFRLVFKVAGNGGPGSGGLSEDSVRIFAQMVSIYGRTEAWTNLGGFDFPPLYTFNNSAVEDGLLIATSWFTPSGSHTVASIVDPGGSTKKIETWANFLGGGLKSGFWSYYIESSFIEVELAPAPFTISDVGIAALSLGFGLEFAADVQGAQTAGTLHASAPDVLEWFLEVFAGLGSSAADATTFAVAETNLGSNKMAGVLNLAGETFGEVIARLCYEARANLVAREGSSATSYLLYAAESDFEWPASVRTLSEFRRQTETEKSAGEQATRFRALYNVDLPPGATAISEEAFRGLVRIDRDQNDASGKIATAALVAAEALWGRRDAEVAELLFVADEATAEDVLAYYAHESIRRAARIGLTVPMDLGYDLELGDLVQVTPSGHVSAMKARVVDVVFDLTQPHVGLVLEEVP